MSERDLKASANLASSIYVDSVTLRHSDRVARIFDDANLLRNWNERLSNVNPEIAQGNMFEQLEVTKFNLDALKKDSKYFARTTASMGAPTDPVDIIISDGKSVVREVQAKSCKTAARTTFALSDEKYKEMARLGPKDQTAKIKELLDDRISKGTLKASDYEQTRRNLQESLRHENVASDGTTYNEALSTIDPNRAVIVARELKVKAALFDMHESGKVGGMVGAGVTAGITLIDGVNKLNNDEAEIGDVIGKIAINSAKGYAVGYTTTALSKGISHLSTEFIGKSASNILTKSNAPIAIAASVVSCAKSFSSFLLGDIDSDTLIDQISHTAITSTSSFYYGVLGQVAIPIPVVGAMVGAGVGYFIGNLLHQSSFIALGECRAVTEAKERRQVIEALCFKAIPEIQKHRQELESNIQKHFSERLAQFNHSFEQMDEALHEWDPDKMLKGLEQINNCFGASLQFTNFKEFDEFMLDPNSTFEF
ncbi:hypothetical protein L1D29_19355 [Shewanella insulae]|uniref:hypothetical protein n=1 Tax=Shewanella insulae TaxID=2681496 RepID=UPI001EFC3530|nr:hypothetical protein [Shewanella insulae]MCG9714958.1 hypothetical protein [Shewanella insulae]